MSTLVAQTLSNGTVSTSSANVIQGSAKAWVNFNGTGTVAIRASYNVSSITDNGTGDYTVNFTNAFADTNFSISASSGNAGVGAGVIYSSTYQQAPTTTSVRMAITTNAGANVDNSYVYLQAFR
jgi:hypothetical protein